MNSFAQRGRLLGLACAELCAYDEIVTCEETERNVDTLFPCINWVFDHIIVHNGKNAHTTVIETAKKTVCYGVEGTGTYHTVSRTNSSPKTLSCPKTFCIHTHTHTHIHKHTHTYTHTHTLSMSHFSRVPIVYLHFIFLCFIHHYKTEKAVFFACFCQVQVHWQLVGDLCICVCE
jgi:hypothetical protein